MLPDSSYKFVHLASTIVATIVVEEMKCLVKFLDEAEQVALIRDILPDAHYAFGPMICSPAHTIATTRIMTPPISAATITASSRVSELRLAVEPSREPRL